MFTVNYQNQESTDKNQFFPQSPSHLPRWVHLVQKTRAKNSHAWAPLRYCWHKTRETGVYGQESAVIKYETGGYAHSHTITQHHHTHHHTTPSHTPSHNTITHTITQHHHTHHHTTPSYTPSHNTITHTITQHHHTHHHTTPSYTPSHNTITHTITQHHLSWPGSCIETSCCHFRGVMQ